MSKFTLLGRGGSKRRRLDPDVIRTGLESATLSAGGSIVDCAGASRKDYLRRLHKHMGSVQAATHLAFRPVRTHEHVGIVSSAWDVFRCGSPAKELVAHLIWASDGRTVSALPPAVPASAQNT